MLVVAMDRDGGDANGGSSGSSTQDYLLAINVSSCAATFFLLQSPPLAEQQYTLPRRAFSPSYNGSVYGILGVRGF